jgi:cytochrome c5
MRKHFALAAFLLSSIGARGQQSSTAGKPVAQKKPNSGQQVVQPSRGEQVFQHNCIRCHTPPEGFSPRISETIAMHMRVRANLSEGDFKALVHFLNP